MPRPASGAVEVVDLLDGTRAFHLRFRVEGERQRVILHERRECECGCGGGWDERGARNELGNTLARVRAGVWTPPERQAPRGDTSSENGGAPTFHEYASWWLQAKIDGTLGPRPIAARTQADYRWRLSNHLLPFFADYRLSEIDRELCLRFKAQKLREAKQLREELAAGADIRDKRGMPRVPLAPISIRRLMEALAAILDDAIEDRHIDSNPARGRRMRVHVPKTKRTFLEMDELAVLLDAAGRLDGARLPVVPAGERRGTAARVAAAAAAGHRPAQIAAQLGLARSTVTHHLHSIGVEYPPPYIGRRVIAEILGRAGVRVSELSDMRVGHLRLHDPDGARFHIPDAKTETGIREVQMSPALVEVVQAHIERLRKEGRPTGPQDHVIQNSSGGRIDRQRVGRIIREAAVQANGELAARGLPPLQHTTPHTLRRTYISIALLANNFDVKWVMSQVGHADSKMTLDVYAQLEQRVDRSHGTNFDRLIESARDGLPKPAASE